MTMSSAARRGPEHEYHHGAAAGRGGEADRSYWLRSIEADAVTRPLHGAADCDVAIVGGGYAGLWTASRIKEQAPETRHRA
jgi:hypothetical protein